MTSNTKPKIAIIGAGFSGIYLGQMLSKLFDVHIFEKSRGIGGRFSCKYTDYGKFNHGAPYFTARKKEFEKYLIPFLENNLISEYKPKILGVRKNGKLYKRKWFEKHYRSEGESNQFLKEISSELNIKFQTQVSKISKENKYNLYDQDQQHLGEFDKIIATAPPQQSFKLFEDHWILDLSEIQFESQFTLCLTISESSFPKYEHLSFDQESPCHFLMEQASDLVKQGYRNIVIHCKRDWSNIFIEEDKDRLLETIVQELNDRINFPVQDIVYSHLHRWKYVQNQIDTEQFFYKNGEENLFIVGDMFRKGNLESAYLSSQKVIDFLGQV